MSPRDRISPFFLTIDGTVELSAQDQKVNVIRLVKRAIALGKEHGKAALLQQTNVVSGGFHVTSGDDLYIFIFDTKGFALAHEFQANLANVNRWDHKDADGKHLARDFCEMVATNGSGWVDNKYTNPKTGKVDSKTSYIESYDGMVINGGVYK